MSLSMDYIVPTGVINGANTVGESVIARCFDVGCGCDVC